VSIDLSMEDDGQLRVSVDRPGERAVSDTIDPVMLINSICDTADMFHEANGDEMIITLPLDLSVPVEGEPQVDEKPEDESA
jgi:hypothetical protein